MTEVFLAKAVGDEHLCGHALARYALERISYSCELILTPNQKPRSTDPNIQLSISHSCKVLAVAVSDSSVGIDIELNKRDSTRLLKLAERFFAPDELEYVRLDPTSRFFEIWCKKESYVKFTGEGFSRSFGGFSVFDLHERFSSFDVFNNRGWICSNASCDIKPMAVQYADFSRYL